MPSKLRYLARVLRHHIQRQPCYCPYCGPCAPFHMLRRKKIVLRILQCDTCGLIFRWPMDTPDEAEAYYQTEYAPEHPQVHLPIATDLDKLLSTNFAGSPLDLNPKIRVLQSLRPNGRVLDYGCSWGYGTYQLQHHGFDAAGFEISKPRARYARERVGVKVFDSHAELAALPDGAFDVIFSHHVIEHLPNIRETFDLMFRLLARGGLAFHVLPNFTGKIAREGMWIMWIGEEHPLAPTLDFFRRNLPRHGFTQVFFGSSPFNDHLAAALASGDSAKVSTDGDELLVVARK